MRIGLIDVDGHHFPNIPLMKISSYHKAKGDSVEWYSPLFSGHMNIVYMSKVFSFTPDYPYYVDSDVIEKGGSGYAIETMDGKEIYRKENDKPLPDEIEHAFPDYSIYGITDTAYGFLTRGCPRGCDFCHVAKKEGRCSVKVADLSEFWNGQKNIVLCDPNILACKDHIELLEQLAASRAYVDFNQGLDIRLINDRNLEVIKRIKVKRFHFAYDRYQDKEIVEKKLRQFKDATGYGHGKVEVYILTNHGSTIEQDLHRIEFCRELDFQPYPMIYNKQNCDPIYRKIQRYCNPFVFWSVSSFSEYRS